jgi:dihydroorotase-like cyclic amidohydrolase
MGYDILLQKGRVIDPVNGVDGILDLGIKDGRVAEIGAELDPSVADQCFDLDGYLVVPGIIDSHVHVSEREGGPFGHKMLAKAGVTTAVDFCGPIDSVLDMAKNHGTGLNIACLNFVRPGYTVENAEPTTVELEKLLFDSLAKGAIGFKILGGHYPLTPEASARVIEVANKHNAYVATHAGSTVTGSNLTGFKEAVELAGGKRLHIAHVNSYCRGRIQSPVTEAEEVICLLKENPNIVSESYLSPLNGTNARCTDGVPDSKVSQTCLEVGGFAPTEEGFAEAILAGWAQIIVKAGGLNIPSTGPEALKYWRDRDTNTTVSFAINPGESRYLLAVARRDNGAFVVDSFSTDGGGYPRNVIVEMGLPLVKFGALSLADFVTKSSTRAAINLGLKNKGHLAPGADADITVIDWERNKAHMAIANGQLIMYNNVVVGKGATIITTAAGQEYVENFGLRSIVVDLQESGFYGER